MNIGDFNFLEILGLSSIIFVLILIAVMITAYFVANSKRYILLHWLLELDDEDLRILERIMNRYDE